MKATKSGQVIGQSMTDYTDEEGPGYVVIFIKSGPSNGIKLNELIPGLTLDEKENNTSDETIEDFDNDSDEEEITPTETIQKMALKYFLANRDELKEKIDISEVYTDRLSAGLEIITPTIIVDKVETNSILVSTGEVVTFESQAFFNIPPLFNKDTAGFALIYQGDRQVEILYEKPYLATPVVNVSLSFDEIDNVTNTLADDIFSQAIDYMVINSSQNGFTIIINKESSQDLRFSWTALSVKDPNIFESIMNGLIIDQNPNQDIGDNNSQSNTDGDTIDTTENTVVAPEENEIELTNIDEDSFSDDNEENTEVITEEENIEIINTKEESVELDQNQIEENNL